MLAAAAQHGQSKFLKGRDRAMQDPRFGDPRWSPAGFVFMATQRDLDEQLKTLLFGYPMSGWGIVQKIIKGTPCFLFDMHHQLFYGIFEATTDGSLNLDPLACGGTHRDGSPFPAQVQCKYHFKFPPTPRWMFQKVPGLFFDGTLRLDRLLSEDQVQRMYTIFNINYTKVMRNLAAAGGHPSMPMPPIALPFPPEIASSGHLMGADAEPWYGEGGPTERSREPFLPRGSLPPGFEDFDGIGEGLDSMLPPKGPKPFGILHTTWSNVHRDKYKVLPRHYTQRPTLYNTKPNKLVDVADNGRNTTVMLANIPDGLTADQCVDSLDQAGFFASYDYLKFTPTLSVRPPRFGSLIINLTSREAAEAVFDEVDRITANWPVFRHPYPQVPVRWAKVQGLQELYPAYGDSAFHLDGLPGSWAIPDETHILFKLPEDPYAERERQRMQTRSRAEPDERAWANAYASSLEAGLDDEVEGLAASALGEATAWEEMEPEYAPLGGRGPQDGDNHQELGGPPEITLPMPPPPAREVHHHKRPAQQFQGHEGFKRQKTGAPAKPPRAIPISTPSGFKGPAHLKSAHKVPRAVPITASAGHKAAAHARGPAKGVRAVPVSAHKPQGHGKHESKQDRNQQPLTAGLTPHERKQDIERRLNSALSSNRGPVGQKLQPPIKAPKVARQLAGTPSVQSSQTAHSGLESPKGGQQSIQAKHSQAQNKDPLGKKRQQKRGFTSTSLLPGRCNLDSAMQGAVPCASSPEAAQEPHSRAEPQHQAESSNGKAKAALASPDSREEAPTATAGGAPAGLLPGLQLLGKGPLPDSLGPAHHAEGEVPAAREGGNTASHPPSADMASTGGTPATTAAANQRTESEPAAAAESQVMAKALGKDRPREGDEPSSQHHDDSATHGNEDRRGSVAREGVLPVIQDVPKAGVPGFPDFDFGANFVPLF